MNDLLKNAKHCTATAVATATASIPASKQCMLYEFVSVRVKICWRIGVCHMVLKQSYIEYRETIKCVAVCAHHFCLISYFFFSIHNIRVSQQYTHTLTNSNEHFNHTQTEPNETSIFSWFAAAITAKRAVTEHFYAKSSQTTRKNSFLKMAASV